MTRNQLNTYLAAILTTLRDLNTGCPASTIHLAIGMDMGKWETVRDVLVQAGMIRIDAHHWVELTEAGKQLADKINATLASA